MSKSLGSRSQILSFFFDVVYDGRTPSVMIVGTRIPVPILARQMYEKRNLIFGTFGRNE